MTRRLVRRIEKEQQGITGIETAIILIAFVIVASVFSYVVLSAGLFSTQKAKEVVCRLYEYFKKHEDELPTEYLTYSENTERRVVDYIAGMTDQYAQRVAAGLKQ